MLIYMNGSGRSESWIWLTSWADVCVHMILRSFSDLVACLQTFLEAWLKLNVGELEMKWSSENLKPNIGWQAHAAVALAL